MLTAEERFWAKVDRGADSECWEWTASRHRFGHGCFYADGEKILAHRFSYKLHFGDIPPGMFVCHHCDNPPCVNPRHLFLGTQGDNMRDKVAKGRHYAPGPTVPASGELNGNSKLSLEAINQIRDHPEVPTREYAEFFGVHPSTINRIKRGSSWKVPTP